MRCALHGCALSVLFSAIACGGGGGGSAPGLAPALAITEANAQAVAASVWLGHSASSAEDVLPDQVRQLLEDYLPLLACRPNALPLEVACGESGAVDVEGTISDAAHPGASAGDQATARYRRCLEARSSILPDMTDGTLVVRVVSATPEGRTLSLRLEALAVGIAESMMLSQNGEATVTLGVDGSASFATDLLWARGGGQVLVLTDYLLGFTPGADGNVLRFRGSQSGGDFQGSVSFDTTVPFHLPPLGWYPDAGELMITGAGGSSVLVRAQPDAVHVALVVNGGTPIETTWDALEE